MVSPVISFRLLSPAWCWSFDERRGAGDVRLDAGRRRGARDDVADRLDGLVRQGLALIARQIQLNVGSLPVGALRARGGQRVPPEVLDVLDMLLVGFELVDQTVIEVVRVLAEGLVAFQDDHHRTVGIELLEVLAHALHRQHRGGVVGGQRHRVRFAHLLQLRRDEVHHHDECDPPQQDGHGEQPDEPRDHRVCAHVGIRHADFTRQNV